MGYAILFLEVELDRRLALQNVEHFEDGLVHFFNPILQNNDHNLVGVNALLVQVDNILPDALKSVVEHGAIFIIHADTDGHFDVAVGFHLAEEVVGVLGANVVEVRVLGRLIVFGHDSLWEGFEIVKGEDGFDLFELVLGFGLAIDYLQPNSKSLLFLIQYTLNGLEVEYVIKILKSDSRVNRLA